MNLSEKILYCRKKAGLSQEALAEKLTQRQVAEKLHVTDRAVSKWERGGSLR